MSDDGRLDVSSPISPLVDDETFDQQLTHYERERSRQYWTPVAVAARVAAAFSGHGAKKILDVGCGPGKFCVVAGSLQRDLELHGIEQRPRLVRLGLGLVRRFGAPNVRLSTGDATLVPWDEYDGLYFFNPFAENTYERDDRFDNEVTFSTMRFGAELLRAESLLARARLGTVLVTYHGLGGAIPSSYELVADERAGTDRVRTWVQRSQQQSSWAWLETQGSVERVSRRQMRSVLASLICGDSSGDPALLEELPRWESDGRRSSN
jgi:SAM-dependent methyltransferase